VRPSTYPGSTAPCGAPSRGRKVGGALAAACLFASACQAPEGELLVPEADPGVFAAEIFPILLADCGFPACHGDPDRMFAVVGPGRRRLSPESLPYDPATPEELAFSYTRARSMLVAEEGPGQGLLLRKPLAEEAGGAGHAGDDAWGAPIFATKTDPRYETIFFWATASEAQP
jgi:hypothetical protein